MRDSNRDWWKGQLQADGLQLQHREVKGASKITDKGGTPPKIVSYRQGWMKPQMKGLLLVKVKVSSVR